MQTKRLMQVSALFALSLLILAACQTQSGGLPSDVTERQETLASKTKAEFCRGQEPTATEAKPVDFAAWPVEARQYVRANNCQWAKACDETLFFQMQCPAS